MTATPRTWQPETADDAKRGKTASTPHETLASMDDPSIYGPVVYSLGLADAIDRGILADYRIVVPVIDDEELLPLLQNRDPSPHNDGLRLSTLQVCLLRAMATHRISRVISFHNRIAHAQRFSETLPETVEAVADTTGIRRLWVYALHSKQPARDRDRRLTEFENVPLLGRRGTASPDATDGAVLSNVRVLGEGVDVPDADAVVFADPKRTSSDILQALGRALRQPPGAGKVAHLILPVYAGHRQSTEDALRSSPFAIVWDVLNGLRTHDAKVWHRMGGEREEREEESPKPPEPERAAEVAPVTSLRMHQTDTRVWARGWTAAVRYFERHGNLDAPSDYTAPDNYPLGVWLGQQRSLYAHGSLSPERALALSTLNISWPHPPGSFEERLNQTVALAERHGTLALPASPAPADSELIAWLTEQRQRADSGRMHLAHHDALSAVDPWWNPPWGITWQHELTHLRRQLVAGTREPTPLSGQDPTGWLDHQLARQHELHPQQATLPAHRTAALTALDPHWNPPWPLIWQRRYHTARRALADNAADPAAGEWLHAQRTRRHTLHPQQRRLLENLAAPSRDEPAADAQAGQASARERHFQRGLAAARAFHTREDHLRVPQRHIEQVAGEPVRLGQWLSNLRRRRHRLTAERVAVLDELGMEWTRP